MKKSKLIKPALFLTLFAIWIILVKTVDVLPIGPAGTSVGFAHLNMSIHNSLGVHMFLYEITGLMGIIAIAIAATFAVTGLIQLIKRRSIVKVDIEIIILGFLYTAVIITYFLFEKVVVNYRPIIMPGETYPEASFPSSHTMLLCVVMGSAARLYDKYIKNIKVKTLLYVFSYVTIAITVVGRLFCGAHWFTDIVGGIIISLFFLSSFNYSLSAFVPSQK